jgi:hypothetical protein
MGPEDLGRAGLDDLGKKYGVTGQIKAASCGRVKGGQEVGIE